MRLDLEPQPKVRPRGAIRGTTRGFQDRFPGTVGSTCKWRRGRTGGAGPNPLWFECWSGLRRRDSPRNCRFDVAIAHPAHRI